MSVCMHIRLIVYLQKIYMLCMWIQHSHTCMIFRIQSGVIGGTLSFIRNDDVFYIEADEWWRAAGVHVTSTKPTSSLFHFGSPNSYKDATFRTCRFDGGVNNSCISRKESDVCFTISSTSNEGDALLLWAKPQPNGAVAILLINNDIYQSFNVSISIDEVGIAENVQNVSLRDVWALEDIGKYMYRHISL